MEFNSQFWNLIKENIKYRNKNNKWLETWLDPVSYVETSGSTEKPRMILGVPSPLHQYFVVENLLEKIYTEISDVTKSTFDVDVIVAGIKAQEPKSLNEALSKAENYQPTAPQSAPTPAIRPSVPAERKPDVLNLDYTFSTFVVGRNTEFAHAASFNVAQNPGAEGYNPLLICGPVGMGKTHLLHAVGNQIRAIYPDVRINYISAERFLNECVSSIRRQEMDKFRLRYREGSDILLVDDVQYIGKTQAVQEEFFHTINSFIERKKQVVLACDRMPKDILGLEDRNRSRLEWGIIADITMPDFETRLAILKYKKERLGIHLDEDVVSHIARISKRSIRELEGNLKKIKMFSELQGLPINIELARKVLASHDTQATISVDDIQKLVADHYRVRIADLKSTSRTKQIVVPRQVCMYLIKRHLDKSLVDIGRLFGGKDHTTVMNAIERIEFLQSKDMDLKNDLDELVTRIHNITGV